MRVSQNQAVFVFLLAGILALVALGLACGPTSQPALSPTSFPTSTATSTQTPIQTPTPDPTPTQTPAPSPTPISGSADGSTPAIEPLNASFLRETEVGEKITDYLGCIDFDCSDKLNAVAALGSEAVVPLLSLLQHGVTPEVAAQLWGDVRTMVRLKAVAALGEIHDPRALEPLVDVLKDSSRLVRAGAASSLGQFSGDADALAALLPLLEDADPLVREMTVNALESLGLPEALPALRDAMETESADYIRSAIAMAIQSLEGR